MRILLAAATLLALAAPIAPANAAQYCFENLGDTGCPWKETFPNWQIRQLSCQNLWYVRNSIYDRRGYCFKTEAAEDMFDNDDCWVKNAGKLKFDNHEWANITRIKKVESNRGC